MMISLAEYSARHYYNREPDPVGEKNKCVSRVEQEQKEKSIEQSSVKLNSYLISRHTSSAFYTEKLLNLLELRVHGVRLEVFFKSSRLFGEDLIISFPPFNILKRHTE
jgi:hypothetical protein